MSLIKFCLMKLLLYDLAFKKSYAKELKSINTVVIQHKMETRFMKANIPPNLTIIHNK